MSLKRDEQSHAALVIAWPASSERINAELDDRLRQLQEYEAGKF